MMLPNKLQGFTDKLFGMNWNKNNILILLFLSSFLAAIMFGENIKAQWWVIDDHEIAYFLGSDHVLRGNEIVGNLLHNTEVAHYLHYPRFRPIYYTLRLLESWAWGAKPSLWYAFRIFVFALFVSFFWYLISQKVGIVIGGFISLYMATQIYWVDIIGRLGPSENYAALGLAFFGLGVHIIYKSNKIGGWWYVFIGTMICSGTKENFLFLILPLGYIVWDFYKRRQLNFTRVALSFGACVWMIWIGFAIVVSAVAYGGDVYNNSTGITARLHILFKLFERIDVIVMLSICTLLLFSKQLFHINNPAILEYSKEVAAITLLLTLIFISQIFFYNGEWPAGTRYDFPGLLIWPIMFVVLLSFFQKITLIDGFTQFRTGLILLSTLGVFLLAFSQLNNIREIRIKNNQNVERTISFSKKMEQLVGLGTQNPEYVIIIQTDNPVSDYEPVFSYFRFLRFYGVKNHISFLWAGRKPEAYSNQFRASLARDLHNLSYYGKEPFMVAGSVHDFVPFPEVENSHVGCILVVISGEPGKNCPIVFTGNWR